MQLLRWNNPGAGHQTSVFHGERGWTSRSKSAPPRREKNVLDIPFYRSGVYTTLRFLFAFSASMSVMEICQLSDANGAFESIFQASFQCLTSTTNVI